MVGVAVLLEGHVERAQVAVGQARDLVHGEVAAARGAEDRRAGHPQPRLRAVVGGGRPIRSRRERRRATGAEAAFEPAVVGTGDEHARLGVVGPPAELRILRPVRVGAGLTRHVAAGDHLDRRRCRPAVGEPLEPGLGATGAEDGLVRPGGVRDEADVAAFDAERIRAHYFCWCGHRYRCRVAPGVERRPAHSWGRFDVDADLAPPGGLVALAVLLEQDPQAQHVPGTVMCEVAQLEAPAERVAAAILPDTSSPG